MLYECWQSPPSLSLVMALPLAPVNGGNLAMAMAMAMGAIWQSDNLTFLQSRLLALGIFEEYELYAGVQKERKILNLNNNWPCLYALGINNKNFII